MNSGARFIWNWLKANAHYPVLDMLSRRSQILLQQYHFSCHLGCSRFKADEVDTGSQVRGVKGHGVGAGGVVGIIGGRGTPRPYIIL